MNQNFINFINFLFFISIFMIILNPINTLHLLLVAEILWICTYFIGIASAIYLNDLILLTLGVFILGFSVVDVGIGFIILIIQKQILNTDLLDDNKNHLDLHYKQVSNSVYLPRYVWK